MQAYKLKGATDQSGHLIIREPIELSPGDVKVIILQKIEKGADFTRSKNDSQAEAGADRVQYKTKLLKDWFANTKPVSPDFDPDQARWEALKEKHQL